ncbi:MAG TPA: hypothetical protein VMM77_05650 [Gemmatimonadaceae bacterium]|nr:hypothetical protein [Gemmatimonadaceae bacterium]
MKKKSGRDIPDFSRHPKRGKDAPAPEAGKKPAPVTPRQITKPPATSSKSGRRGS